MGWREQEEAAFESRLGDNDPALPEGTGAMVAPPDVPAEPSMGSRIVDSLPGWEDIRQYGMSGMPSLARGAAHGIADMGDSAIGAANWAMGNPATEGPGPLKRAVQDYIDPAFAGIDNPVANFNSGAGELTAQGAGGVGAVGLAAGGLRRIPGAGQRLKAYASSLEMGGMGPSPTRALAGPMGPIPAQAGGSGIASAGARLGMGGGAAGISSAVMDMDNPQGMAAGAGLGMALPAVGVPLGRTVAPLWEAGSRAFNSSRAPELAEEALRKAAGQGTPYDRTPQILQNLGQGGRIGRGLPAQLANDKGISGAHNYLKTKLANDYEVPTDAFLTQQENKLMGGLQGRSAGLESERAAANAATKGDWDALSKSQEQVSMRPVAEGSVSDYLRGGVMQGSPDAKPIHRMLEPFNVKAKGGGSIPGISRQENRGLAQEANAGVVANTIKAINDRMSPTFQMSSGKVMTDSQMRLMGGLKANLQEALGTNSTADAMYQGVNTKYKDLMRPVNQKEHMAGIFAKGDSGVPDGIGGNKMNTDSLAKSIDDVLNDPDLAPQFTTEQRTYLDQLRNESVGNRDSLVAGVNDVVTDTVVPEGLTQSMRVLKGPLVRGVQAGIKMGSSGQVGRVDKAMADIMREPAGAQTLMRILGEINKPMGRPKGALTAGLAKALNTSRADWQDEDEFAR